MFTINMYIARKQDKKINSMPDKTIRIKILKRRDETTRLYYYSFFRSLFFSYFNQKNEWSSFRVSISATHAHSSLLRWHMYRFTTQDFWLDEATGRGPGRLPDRRGPREGRQQEQPSAQEQVQVARETPGVPEGHPRSQRSPEWVWRRGVEGDREGGRRDSACVSVISFFSLFLGLFIAVIVFF